MKVTAGRNEARAGECKQVSMSCLGESVRLVSKRKRWKWSSQYQMLYTQKEEHQHNKNSLQKRTVALVATKRAMIKPAFLNF